MPATIKISELRPVLARYYQKGRPILLVSPPGIGKSSIAAQAASDASMEIVFEHPVLSDPTDYKGLPLGGRNGAGQFEAHFVPYDTYAQMMETQKPTVWFFDDLGQAPLTVQAALMQLALARELNGKRLSPQVRLGFATNPRQGHNGVRDILSPLLDRMWGVFHVVTSLECWVKWATEIAVPPIPHQGISYVRFAPDILTPKETDASTEFVKTATPRSLAMALQLFAEGEQDYTVLAATAGEAFAAGFLGFLRVYAELPSADEVLATPKTAAVPKPRDALYALMGSLAAHVTQETFEQLTTYLARVPPEFRVMCVKDAVRRESPLTETPVFEAWVVANQELFGATPK